MRKLFKYIWDAVKIVLVILVLLEVSYRSDIIDFFSASWKHLNKEELIKEQRADLLVIGDSFSANNESYVSFLRNYFPEKSIYNASQSGIGLNEVNVFAERRIDEVNPKAILYQVYVGNDLIDIKALRNFKKASIARSAYWEVSNYITFLKYANQHLNNFRNSPITHLKKESDFSFKNYNERTKLYATIDSGYLQKSIIISGDFEAKYRTWKKKFNSFLNKIPEDISVYVVFIPHCAQLNGYYCQNFETLGFSVDNVFSDSYPFFDQAKNDFKGRHIKFLNPLSFLRSRDNEINRLYYSNDPHFNSNGHRELATYLKNYIF